MRVGFAQLQLIHQPALGALDDLALLQHPFELMDFLHQRLQTACAKQHRADSLRQRLRADRIAHDVYGLVVVVRLDVILRHDHHHAAHIACPARQLHAGHIRQLIRRQEQDISSMHAGDRLFAAMAHGVDSDPCSEQNGLHLLGDIRLCRNHDGAFIRLLHVLFILHQSFAAASGLHMHICMTLYQSFFCLASLLALFCPFSHPIFHIFYFSLCFLHILSVSNH